MGWWSDLVDRVVGREAQPEPPARPPVPTSADILASLDGVRARTDGAVPPIVAARIARIDASVRDIVPRLDRLGAASRQGHTVVATATSYLPEAVDGYLRLPREFADRRPVHQGKTALMLLCDQLDLLTTTLEAISDAVSRADAVALVAHGQFLQEKFAASGLALPTVGASPDTRAPQQPGADA